MRKSIVQDKQAKPGKSDGHKPDMGMGSLQSKMADVLEGTTTINARRSRRLSE